MTVKWVAETKALIRERTKTAMARPEVIEKAKRNFRPSKHSEETKVNPTILSIPLPPLLHPKAIKNPWSSDVPLLPLKRPSPQTIWY